MSYNKTNRLKLQIKSLICFVLFFASPENFIMGFSGNEFSQDCSGNYFLKYIWVKG